MFILRKKNPILRYLSQNYIPFRLIFKCKGKIIWAKMNDKNLPEIYFKRNRSDYFWSNNIIRNIRMPHFGYLLIIKNTKQNYYLDNFIKSDKHGNKRMWKIQHKRINKYKSCSLIRSFVEERNEPENDELCAQI